MSAGEPAPTVNWGIEKGMGGMGMRNQIDETTSWTDRARALAPLVLEWREASEKERRLAPPLVVALREADIFRMSVPESAGGSALDEVTAMAVIEELSRQDGSVGWNAMVASNTAIMASALPAAALRDVYRAGPNTILAGGLLPKGAAVPVPGGFRLTGRWSMASGCHEADWLVGGCIVKGNDGPRLRADGTPEMRGLVVPMKDCRVIDTWHTTGLRATGSHDCEVNDVIVPEHMSFAIVPASSSEPNSVAIADFAACAIPRVAAIALGIARDAIESFIALAKAKTPAVSTTTLAAQHTTHERVGRAEAMVRAGRIYLYETVKSLPFKPDWSAPLDDEQRAAMRLAGSYATQCAVDAVDLMFSAAGTSGFLTSSRLDRCFRDVHVTSQHIVVAQSNIEMVGSHLLGLGLPLRR
jgi:indole-3-acetate monooxygenase